MKHPIHGVEAHNENSCKKRLIISFFPDDFGLRSPVIQKKKLAKKRYIPLS